jgi:hypothetical protein
MVAIYADIRAWKGRPGLSENAKAGIRAGVAGGADTIVVLFGHPRLAAQVEAPNVVVAWGGEPVMQRAAARFIGNELSPPTAA